MTPLPPDSVRGRVRAFIERHAALLGKDVLEVGTRQHDPAAWWVSCRDLARGQWTGIDSQDGPGVDRVADLHTLPTEWDGRFTGVVCSEVLEHVARPWIALPRLRAAMKTGGVAVFTTLFAFPEHSFPDDFYRYSRAGLRLLLEDAGFKDVDTEYAGGVTFTLNDHGEPHETNLIAPIHVFAIARA